MRKIFIALALMTPIVAFGASEVREVAQGWRVATVSVSTTNATIISSNTLTGRYKVIVENTDPSFELSIGTSSVFTYSNGFIVKVATSPLSQLTLPLAAGTTVYGLGQSGTQATVNVRVIEFK